jgi:hypothetical protein
MRRYTVDKYIRYDTDGPNAEAAMVETDDGEWVRQDEAAAEIERLRSVLSRIHSLCDGIKSRQYITGLARDALAGMQMPPNTPDRQR